MHEETAALLQEPEGSTAVGSAAVQHSGSGSPCTGKGWSEACKGSGFVVSIGTLHFLANSAGW